jgi:phosphate transport system permease protein
MENTIQRRDEVKRFSSKKAKTNQKIMKNLCIACGIFVAIVVFSIIGYVGKQGIQVFKDVSILEFFTSTNWDPANGSFGAYVFIRGTLILTLLSVLIGGTFGIAAAVFMAKIAPTKLRNILRYAVELFVGIPSVVYGFIGLTVIVPLVRKLFPESMGFGFLPAAIILGIMILPTIINISEDSIRSVDRSLEEGSYAMGATRLQTIVKIIIPSAMPGISSGIILGMARALGETMAVLMVIGNAPQLTNSLVIPTNVLTTGIAMDMTNTQFGSTWNNALFMMATLLLIISLVLIILVRLVSRRRHTA